MVGPWLLTPARGAGTEVERGHSCPQQRRTEVDLLNIPIPLRIRELLRTRMSALRRHPLTLRENDRLSPIPSSAPPPPPKRRPARWGQPRLICQPPPIVYQPSTIHARTNHQPSTPNSQLSTIHSLDSFAPARYARIMQARQLAPRSSGRATAGLPAPNTTLSLRTSGKMRKDKLCSDARAFICIQLRKFSLD